MERQSLRAHVALVVVALLAAAAAGRAQSRFKDLSPGESTRADVARVLGAPSRVISQSVSEYPAPAGMARVEVTFDARDRAQRIEVYLDPPVTRRALAESYGVSQPDGRGDHSGRLVEFFAGEKLIAFTFVGEKSESGVDRVGHFTRKAFTDASGIPMPEPTTGSGTSAGRTDGNAGSRDPGPSAPPGPAGKSASEKTAAILNGISNLLGAIQSVRGQQATWNVGNQATLEGIYLAQYQAPAADRCQADCAGNASCRAYVFVRAGNPNPGDPAMCFLMSSATRAVPSPCCIAGVKSQK